MANRRRLSLEEREAVYSKMSGRCAYCGEPIAFGAMQVDHVVPLRKGGADTLDNMLPACRSCNHYKSTLTVEQFIQFKQDRQTWNKTASSSKAQEKDTAQVLHVFQQGVQGHGYGLRLGALQRVEGARWMSSQRG